MKKHTKKVENLLGFMPKNLLAWSVVVMILACMAVAFAVFILAGK